MNDAVKKILALPKKSLEERINNLEQELIERGTLRDEALTTLFTTQRHLKAHARRERYTFDSAKQLSIQQQLSQLDKHIHEELTNCFQDMSERQEKLALLREELALSEEKLNLVR